MPVSEAKNKEFYKSGFPKEVSEQNIILCLMRD